MLINMSPQDLSNETYFYRSLIKSIYCMLLEVVTPWQTKIGLRFFCIVHQSPYSTLLALYIFFLKLSCNFWDSKKNLCPDRNLLMSFLIFLKRSKSKERLINISKVRVEPIFKTCCWFSLCNVYPYSLYAQP